MVLLRRLQSWFAQSDGVTQRDECITRDENRSICPSQLFLLLRKCLVGWARGMGRKHHMRNVAVIYVEGTRNTIWSEKMRHQAACWMVHVCWELPTKRKTVAYKKPATPPKLKISSASFGQHDVVVSWLVVTYGLVRTFRHIPSKVVKSVKFKKAIGHPKVTSPRISDRAGSHGLILRLKSQAVRVDLICMKCMGWQYKITIIHSTKGGFQNVYIRSDSEVLGG
jgi:hypothetical protein